MEDLVHALYEPAGDGPHPAVIALHGRGSNALDLLGLSPYLGGGRFLMICPQGPVATPIGPEITGHSWYPMATAGSHDPEAMAAGRDRLNAFVDRVLRRYPIDPMRLAVLGFSQGGVMAYALGLSERRRFAAVAALSSWLPEEILSPVSKGVEQQPLPLLVQHGSRDTMVDVARAHEAVERLRGFGVQLTYREYDMGHEITPRSLRDLSAWLEEKLGSSIVLAG